MTPVEMSPEEIVRRVTVLKAHRSAIEFIWQIVEKYISPLRVGDMFARQLTETQISYYRDDVYDSTAIDAAQKFAANIHGTVTNPAFKWFEFQWKTKSLRQDKEAVAWLQECTEVVYEELYDSNFDSEISSAFQDLVDLGNAIVVSEVENDSKTDWQGFNFTAAPIRECFFERDHRGNLVRFYRWLEWTAVEIASKLKKEDRTKLPEEIEVCLKEGGDPEKRFTVIFCVYERASKKKSKGSRKALAPKERAYGVKHVLMMSKLELGEEDGYYEMPACHAPWERTSGSKWGHGPGMVMAPTVEYLNNRLEMEEMAIRKAIDPPTLVRQRGLLSDLNQKPGEFTLVTDVERDVKVLGSGARIDLSHVSIEDLRKMIRHAFHEDELQLKESPQMSATEAQIRYELMNRVLGPTMGRIQNGLLDPTLMRTFMTLLRNGRFPPMPKSAEDARGQPKIHYSGPLVRAQKMDEVASMDRFVGDIGAMAKVFPPVMNVIDPIKYAREKAERMGIPASILRTDSEVQAMQKQQQAVQAELAKARLMQEKGKGMQEMKDGQTDEGQQQ
jgi:hypothetical protein